MSFDEIDLRHAGKRVTGHGRAAWIAEAREMLRLALPLAATQLAQMIILATDTFMLGHLSESALAAAALGNILYALCWLFGAGPGFAVAPVIAHILGANARDRAGVRNAVRMGFWASLILAVPLLVILGFARDILVFFRQDPALAQQAGRFVGALALGLPFALGYQCLRNFATALSRPIAPLIVMGLAILFNAVGDYALIFGHFGAPRLELLGAGLASSASNAFSFLALLTVCVAAPGLRGYRILRRLHRPHAKKLAELFRLGIPIGIGVVFEVLFFNGSGLIMGTFGKSSLAAHQIALTIPSLTFMVPLGVGLAAAVRVGLAKGAGDSEAAQRAGFTAMAIGGGFMALAALAIIAFPSRFASLWFADPRANQDAIALAVTFLHVAAIFQIADGLQVTAGQALRGLKDARAPMWIAGASYWLAGFPMCLLLGYGFHLRGLGIWLGLAFGILAAAILLVTRFFFLSRPSQIKNH